MVFLKMLVGMLLLLDWCSVNSVNPEGSLVTKLMARRDSLMQDGLSFFNGTTVKAMQSRASGHDVRCLIHIENWTKWSLAYPVFYNKYGVFQSGESNSPQICQVCVDRIV